MVDILGALRAADRGGVVRIERRYATSPTDLWSAITDPDRLARWYGRVEGDLRAGGEIRVHLESADLDSVGRIEECDAPRRLVVTTRETDESRSRGRGGEPFVQTNDATLSADGEGTTLVLEIRGLPLSALGAYGAGWQIHTESLAAHLAGHDGLDVGALWADLLAPYEGDGRRSALTRPLESASRGRAGRRGGRQGWERASSGERSPPPRCSSAQSSASGGTGTPGRSDSCWGSAPGR